ncbi:HDOD domain protein [Gemmata obscuriglobus]|uniref:HDOD domain-containing protein n=1 Tax=Gemmata obscuriglobus TaxID=114 RepID=A0A2Z3H073_9BACT|nr:HDOD domain-containing protein [Gemmata obscuriglobus]AWM38251.1 HDOD domain-containing protein [Gemmata obscuriglobus]QEG28844.1 HDOD domain protein [Gemmata obscuriglobus]VTS07259.1 metal dependent phosphohydrolase : HDIG domain protein OS=Treponema phagedenis F0421 GN=HMPREF9554_01175 PE=4 SV=1: HDOD [Gemmata obscuriglobus UQM 2246]
MPLLKRFSDALRAVFAPAPPTARERSARLERQIRALVDTLPALPATAVRALALMDDPDVSLGALAELIRSDTALATGLLRVANSALFAGGSAVLRVDQAVVRLGLWQCKSLVTTIGIRRVLSGKTDDTAGALSALWHHGYVTASLCSALNRTGRLGFGGEEYAAGLLHDIGRVLIALADAECVPLARLLDFADDLNPTAREREALGADHCELGAWFALLSNLPGALIDAIKHHHAPAGAPRLAVLVAAADHMANHLECATTAEGYDPTTNSALALLLADRSAGHRDALFANVPGLMTDALGCAGATMTHTKLG